MPNTLLSQEETALAQTGIPCLLVPRNRKEPKINPTSSYKTQYTGNKSSNRIQGKDQHLNVIQYKFVGEDLVHSPYNETQDQKSSMLPKKKMLLSMCNKVNSEQCLAVPNAK